MSEHVVYFPGMHAFNGEPVTNEDRATCYIMGHMFLVLGGVHQDTCARCGEKVEVPE